MPPAYSRQPLNLTSNASQLSLAEQAASQSRVKSSRFVVFLSHCSCSNVPTQLATHPAAKAPPGTRNERGELVGAKKDKVQYSKK